MKGKMVKQNSFVFLVVLTLFFVGCFPMFPVSRQSKIYEKDIKKIVVGTTTKAEVYDLLGKPNFLENDRYCVYEVHGWYGGIVIGSWIDFGGEIFRILLEFNENDTLINYEVEKGVISSLEDFSPYYIHPKIAISPNGKTLAVLTHNGKVWLINLETEEKVELGKYNRFATPEFSPDSRKFLLIGNDVKVIDVSNHSKAFLFKGQRKFSFWTWGSTRVTTCLAFFPDGKKVATGGSRGFIKIWELSTGTEIMTLKTHNGDVDSIEISPDGKIIATGLDDNIKIWDSTTGNEIMTFKTHEKKVDSIEISPDGKIIATGSGATIRIWDSTTGTELYHMISETVVFTRGGRFKQGLFKFSPDGKLFAVNRGTHVELWSINQERDDLGIDAQGIFKGLADVFLLPVFDESFLGSIQPSLDFSKDGQILAASFGSIIVYNLNNRKNLWSYNFNRTFLSYSHILNHNLLRDLSFKYAALHPNGKLLFIFTEKDKEVTLVNLKQER